MPEIEVNLIDQSGKNIRVRLPDDRPIGQLAAAIRRKLNMPDTDERGRLQVVLHHKISGRDLQPERTLTQESVQNGETLRLRMEAVAGGYTCPPPRAKGGWYGDWSYQTPSVAGRP